VADQYPQKHVQTISLSILKSFEKLKIQPKLCSPLYISSRTDAGVHALHNTANIDLDYEPSKINYSSNHDPKVDQDFCEQFSSELNENLRKNDDLIK
jgi:tRNA U38,U39,U40 pseudouridine synthase TruA